MEDERGYCATCTTTGETSLIVNRSNGARFTCTPSELDLMMSRYLPASRAELRRIVEAVMRDDFSDLTTITELLIVLAEIDRF